ncbi:hypothetical protein [Alsobacter sp. SYSU BS001988]
MRPVLLSAIISVAATPVFACDVQAARFWLAEANEQQQWAEFWADMIPSEEVASRAQYARALTHAVEASADCSAPDLDLHFISYLRKRSFAATSAYVRSTAKRDR